MKTQDKLRDHGLRVTGTRVAVLELLQKSERALSQADVERALPAMADRVTLFRVLQALEEAGLAHRLMDAHGVACYASCSPSCSTEEHHDTHAHFRCTQCSSIFCLEPIALPAVKVPSGFRLTASHLDLEGQCKSCA